jgi:uncharacterized membrane protein YfcA
VGALAILVVSTLIAFTVSSTLGMGGGVLMLPGMLAVYDTPTAIAMIAPLMLVNAAGKLWVFRQHLDLGVALRLGVLGWPMAFVAGFFVDRVDGDILKAMIVALIAAMLCLEHGLGREIHLTPRALPGWGAATGVLSGLTGVSGPTLALSLKANGVTGSAFVANVALVALGLQCLRIPAYISRGVLPSAMLPMLAVLGVLALIAVRFGRAIQKRMSVERWRLALDSLLAGVAVFLAADILGVIGR